MSIPTKHPQGLNLHAGSLPASVPTLLPMVTGSIVSEAGAQTSCVCEISVFKWHRDQIREVSREGDQGVNFAVPGLQSSGSETLTLRHLHCWKRHLDPKYLVVR